MSNLPYTATSTDLNTLFSDIAPVRTAFVVLEHGTGISKGVGYVTFAIREDATMALDKISKEGITLDGRSLRVQWAGSKVRIHFGSSSRQSVNESKCRTRITNTARGQSPSLRRMSPHTLTVTLHLQTLLLSAPSSSQGFLQALIQKRYGRRCESYQAQRGWNGLSKQSWARIPASVSSPSSLVAISILQLPLPFAAHAIFETPATASEAVDKLHAHVFKGSLLSAALKRRLDSVAKAVAARKTKQQSSGTQQKGAPAPNRASRLIVRNLPFDITEQDLRAIFLPYGPIHSIHIPLAADVKSEDTDVPRDEEGEERAPRTRPKSKGFAFVWFLIRKDAEKAMEGCNGMTVEAGMAETMFSDKQKKKKQRREEKKRKAHEGGGSEDEEDEQEEGKGKRTIAVDWALSKDKWEAEKAKLEADVEMGASDADDGSDDEGTDSDKSGEESGEEDSEDEQLGVHESGSDEEGESEESDSHPEDDNDDEEVGVDEKPAKPTLPAPEVGTTVFVRNVPFEATEDELRTL